MNATEVSRAPKALKQEFELGRLLETHDLVGIKAWAKRDSGAFRSLQALLFESDELLRWHAIEALGLAAAVKAEKDLEPVRNLLRRLFFSLNEDSGMVGWHSPEAIGEVLAQVKPFAEEFGVNLISYLRQPPFVRGAHWAVARVAGVYPEAVREGCGELLVSLGSTDPYVRGFAASALGALDSARAGKLLDQLREDGGALRWYDFESGGMVETSVGELAQAALAAFARR